MSIGKFAGGLAAGAAVTLIGVGIGQVFKDTPRPSLFSSLPPEALAIAPAVDTAVKVRFPAGSSEDALIACLSVMGFVMREGEGGLWAEYTAGGLGCTESFSVTWVSGPDGLIEEVSGHYHLSCL